MKKILILIFLLTFSQIALCANEIKDNLKRVDFLKTNEWIQLKFDKKVNEYWFELNPESNKKYTILLSGNINKRYGKPTIGINGSIYEENLNNLLQTSTDEKSLEVNSKNNRIYIKVEKTKAKKSGTAYILITEADNATQNDNQYNKVKDKPQIQKFNQNPLKLND